MAFRISSTKPASSSAFLTFLMKPSTLLCFVNESSAPVTLLSSLMIDIRQTQSAISESTGLPFQLISPGFFLDIILENGSTEQFDEFFDAERHRFHRSLIRLRCLVCL